MAVKRREAVVAPGLLKKIQFPPPPKTKKRIKERFDLGMNEWNNSDDSNDDFLPLKKIPKSGCTRFAQLTSEEELEEKSKGVVPKNTQKDDQWALKTFMEWMEARNKHSQGDQCSKTYWKPKMQVLIEVVVTFYDRSAKERRKQVFFSVNSLAALWIAVYYAS